MTDYTDLCTRVLQSLGDPAGDKYDANILLESFRQIVPYFDQYYPQVAADTITLENTEREVELDLLVNCKTIISIVHPPDNTNHNNTYSPPYYTYFKNAIPWVKFLGTYNPIVGDQFLITYITGHYIDGLDDAEQTTIPYELRGFLVEGTCAIAKRIRALALIEEYGTRTPDVTKLLDQYNIEFDIFRQNLACLHSFTMAGYPQGFDI